MKAFALLTFLLYFSFSSYAQLKIKFTNINSTDGKLVMECYDSETSFQAKEAFIKTTISIDGTEVAYQNDNLKSGNYVVRVFHDINDNNELDKNFVGIPKEPYGVSNNAKEQFGPPKYEKARFYYDGTSMSISIALDEH